MILRRVLILADESADWIVAGLRQLDRLALSLHEFQAGAPLAVCVFWKPGMDPSQRWTPQDERLRNIDFTTDLDAEPYDLVLPTRLFLYRKALESFFSEGAASARPAVPEETSVEIGEARKQVPSSEEERWVSYSRAVESLPRTRVGAWEYIRDGNQIDEIEKRFLRGSGKSQDGLVSRYLNRPISRRVTRLLLRFPSTPNAWTWLIFPIPVVAALLLAQGTYWSFVWGLVFFQVFSVLDGCDGEIARAKFLESERGRQLDDLFDVLSNILLVLGLGVGLRQAQPGFGWVYLAEGIAAAALIAINEWYLATRKPPADAVAAEPDSLGETLYPRHRDLVKRSGLLVFGEKFTGSLIQLTKRDVAVMFFVMLAVIGIPSLILHLVLVVTAATLAFALKS